MPRSHIGPARGADAVTVLSVYLVLLLAVPAPMVVAALGSAGAPATIMALASFVWWLWFHVQRDEPLHQGLQPVRLAMLSLVLIMLIVYVHAMSGPIPGDEVSPADSGMLRLLGMAGLVLVANDGIASLARSRILTQRLVLGVGIVAILGIVQYATKDLWIDRISIPGLTTVSEWSLGQRSGLARPSGTSTHPIEYGVVLTMVLPLAIVHAQRARRGRWLFVLLLGAIGFAIFLSISRSAIVCGVVAMVVLAAGWSMRARLVAMGVTTMLLTVVYLTVPGLLGTLGRLFTGAGDDSSVLSRTNSYVVAAEFIERSPVLGRGFGTFLPKYWILDNGYLGVLIEGGVIGLVALLGLIVAAVCLAWRARQLAVEQFDRDLAQAILAAVAAGASGLAFFDIFGFPQSAGTFFLLLGLAGGTWRLARADARSRIPVAGPTPAGIS